METKDIIPVLIGRMNNLETILVSTLFGFILTTTLTLFAAYYNAKDAGRLRDHPGLLLVGANFLYVFLSGYYYFMLTHFYAIASILVPYVKEAGLANGANLWSFFRVPPLPSFIDESSRNFLSLLNAAIFPLLFSSCSITGMFLLIKNHLKESWQKKWALPLSCLAQAITWYVMISYPFFEFLASLNGPAGNS